MDENNKEIKELWLKGLTGNQIAKQLSITRNSVMGKLHRMRHSGILAEKALDERMKTIRTAVRKKIETTLELEHKPDPDSTVNAWIPRPEPVEQHLNLVVCEEAPPQPTSKPIPFEKLTSRSCRFIINSGDPKDFLFCGKPKKGRSYCDEHENVCYYRPLKRNENNEPST